MSLPLNRPRPVRVLVSEMTPLISSGIAAALKSGTSFEVRSGRLDELLEGHSDGLDSIDVVVIDWQAGLRLAAERSRPDARARVKAVRIFAINQACGERDIRRALEAGVHGYATLSLGLEEFQDGVRSVAHGLRYVCPRSAQRLANSMTHEQLTPREAEVLAQLSHGSCNKVIASELAMALGTVKAHVKSLMAKLDAKTRTQVVSVAISRGLLDATSGFDSVRANGGRSADVRFRADELEFAAG